MKMIPDKESLTVEFKSDRKKLHDGSLIEAVAGMTNSRGGCIYLGVEDDGEITGVHPAHRNPDSVNGLISSRTVPSLTVRSQLINENNLDILQINVPQSTEIIATSNGRTLRRVLKPDGTPENIPMYPYQALSRLSGFREFDYSALLLEQCTVTDLDSNQILRLRCMIQEYYGDQALLPLNDKDLLIALGLIELSLETNIYHPTVAGLLLLGKKEKLKECLPTARITFQALNSQIVKVNETYIVPILEAYEILMKNIAAYNFEYEHMIGSRRIGIPSYSPVALREALINAFSHRDYTIMQDILVQIQDYGLTVNNPGGFIEGISTDNLIDARPRSRNQLLTDILKT